MNSKAKNLLILSIAAVLLASIAHRFASTRSWATPKPKNVVIISVDGLRYDYAKRMESLARFFADASVFDQAISAASFTPPSLCSLQTGLVPLKHGVHLTLDTLNEDDLLLSEVLRRNGFYTEALIAVNIVTGIGLDREAAWDRWTHYTELPYKQADFVTDRALEMLGRAEAVDRPYYLWVHYFDPHIPFRAPDEHYVKDDARPEYAAEVRFVDHELRRFLQALDWDDTMVVFTSDHGWGLWLEHDYGYHYHKLYEEQIRVPLLLHVPGRTGGSVLHQVRTIDVFPTVLDELGVEFDTAIDGVNLFSERVMPTYSETHFPRGERDPEVIERLGNSALQAIRWRGLKLIYAVDEPKQSLLFDLAADPREASPLDLETHRREFENLYWLLQSFNDAQTDEERLRALGYAQ
ncbi:MAG: sulfatase [Deltaproteobacteria bacterium]|nr:MAG: sulfatase [Deltaproteobacteria bacterium]